jgi:3-phosphoshikimate 1-carboxyvinyltransferase
VPGDKSVSHRSLLFGAMTNGRVDITGLGTGEDNARTKTVIQAMGVRVVEKSPTALTVHGVGLRGFKKSEAPFECGNSGTSMRLLTGFLAGQPFTSILQGDESLTSRPMLRVIDPLSQMGAKISGQKGKKAGEVYPPLRIEGQVLGGIRYESKVASAQVKSAILLAGLYAKGTTEVIEPGPSRDHTERMLAYLGAPIEWADRRARVTTDDWDETLEARPLAVPGDPSSAAFLCVAGLLTGASRMTIENVCVNPTRTGFLDVLKEMGARVTEDERDDEAVEPTADLVLGMAAGGLRGITVEGERIVRAIDELPILAVLAAFAAGTTTFKDAEELRVKESDRIKTTCDMLRAFGVDVEEKPDGMVIDGRPGRRLKSATIHAHGDHRIAMSAVIGGLCAEGEVRVEDARNVLTSFPTFVDVMQKLGADVRPS